MSIFNSIGNFFNNVVSNKLSNPKPNIVLQPTNGDEKYSYKIFFSKETRKVYLIVVLNATNKSKTKGSVFDFVLTDTDKYRPKPRYPMTENEISAIPSLTAYLSTAIPSDYVFHCGSTEIDGNLTKSIYAVFNADLYGVFRQYLKIKLSYKHSGSPSKSFFLKTMLNYKNFAERYPVKECLDLIIARRQEERKRNSLSQLK